MRRINFKFVGGTLIGFACLAGIVHLVHYFQMQRHATAFLREARRAAESGKPGEALGFYQRYVALAPNDVEGRSEYGMLLADAGAFDRAYFTLEGVLRADPNRDDVRRKQIQVGLALGRLSDAESSLEYLLEKLPNDGELWMLLGQCQTAQRQYDAAAKSFETAISHAPDKLEPYMFLATLLRTQLNRPNDANDWVNRMVDANPKNYKSYLYRGSWRIDDSIASTSTSGTATLTGDAQRRLGPEAAEAALADAHAALELAPDALDANLFASQVAARSGALDEAEKHANHALEIDASSEVAYELLAGAKLIAGDRNAAIERLRDGVKALPTSNALQWQLANLLIDDRAYDEASKIVDALSRSNYPRGQVGLLKGRLRMGAGEWSAAVEEFSEARPLLAASPTLRMQLDYWMGKCYEQLGNPDQQLAAYQRALETDPTWTPARIAVANTQAATGNLESSLVQYQRLATQPNAPPEILATYGRLLLMQTAQRPVAQRDFAPVRNVLERLDASHPDSPHAVLLRAELDMAEGRPDDAATTLTDARTSTPNRLDLWTASIALAARNQDWNQVDQLFEAAEKQFGFNETLKAAKAHSLVRRYGANAGSHLKALASEVMSAPSDEVGPVLLETAKLAYSIQDFDLAEELAKKSAELQPRDLQVRLLLFEIAFRQRNLDSMKRLLDEVGSIEGHGAMWHYGEAVRLNLAAEKEGSSAPLAAAQEHLVTAQSLRPQWGRVPVLSANIHEKQGNIDLAIDRYREAMSLGERDPLVIKHFITLLFQQQRYEEVDRLIRELSAQQEAIIDDLGQIAAMAAFRMGARDRALEIAESIAEKSNRYEDHVWLGQLFGSMGNYERAQTELRTAAEMAPTAIEPWTGLAVLLVRTNARDQIRNLMDEAMQSVGADKAALLQARFHELLEEHDAALAKYEEALAQSPDDMQLRWNVAEFYLRRNYREKAEAAFERILADDKTGALASQARRNLAILLYGPTPQATAGGEGDSESAANAPDARKVRAMQLIETNLAQDKSSLPDLLLKASMLAQNPSREDQATAIQILESLPAAQRRPQDDFLLAQLYFRSGDLAKSRQTYRALAAANPDNPSYVAYYIDSLLRANEPAEAELWIDRLKAMAPDAQATISLEARVLFESGRHQRLVDSINEWASVASAATASQQSSFSRWLWAANQFETYATRAASLRDKSIAKIYQDATADAYQKHLEQTPDDILAQASLHTLKGEADPVLELLDKNYESATPEKIASVAMTLLASQQDQPDVLKRMQEIVDRALGKHGRPLPLVIAAADLASWREDYATAEKLYREVLAEQPNNVRCLNNLALALVFDGRQHEEALAMIQKAIAVAGPQGDLLDSRGLIYLATGQTQKALADFEESIAERPAPDRHFHSALAQASLKQTEAAKQALATANEAGLALSKLHPGERQTFGHLIGQLQ